MLTLLFISLFLLLSLKFKLTGLVSLQDNATLDFESKQEFRFIVYAQDGHMTSAPTYVHLHVTDVNEAPRTSRQEIVIEAQEGKVECVLLVVMFCQNLYFEITF